MKRSEILFLGEYFEASLKRTYDNLYKIGDMIILGKNDNVPQFGRIYVKEDSGNFGIMTYHTTGFDNLRHSYEVSSTANVLSAHPSTFYINESMRLYFDKYVRLPYALP